MGSLKSGQQIRHTHTQNIANKRQKLKQHTFTHLSPEIKNYTTQNVTNGIERMNAKYSISIFCHFCKMGRRMN